MFHGCISRMIRLTRIRAEPAYCDRNHQRPEAGQLGKFEAEHEAQESCLGLRHVCPGSASASASHKVCKTGTIERRWEPPCVVIFMCCLDGTIGAFPGAKPRKADAIGLDQRCSAGGWIAGQGQDLLERLAI